MRSHTMKVLSLSMILAVIACDNSATGPDDQVLNARTQASTQGSIVAAIRAATVQFHDVDAATDAGYVLAGGCVAAEGVRYRNPALVNGVIDLSQPEILIYVPRKNGELGLGAVQYLVASALWDAAHSSPPSLGDQAFMDRRSPPFGAPFANYSLVAWVWSHNPSGMYQLQNPSVSCDNS